ncbi:MAG: ABC transporter permease, partial [Gammaproteobacteria bacterium]|nr:ABC transporter permease [Gammaproteobacteria bacterium]
TFIHPLLFVTVLYIIFAMGLRMGASMDMPFELYLICGMIAWMYFSENVSSGAGSIKAYSFLVKKIDFRLSMLPIIKLCASLVPHIALIMVGVVICWIQGYAPSLFTLQIFYYLFSMMCLLLGIGWMTSSSSIFIKDISNVITVVLQFGFWLTPIFWNVSIVPERYSWIVFCNPAAYIVNGYRDSLVAQVPFWERGLETFCFWIVTAFFLLVGIIVYRRLRPHFAEVI